jgi:hypothetical protein
MQSRVVGVLVGTLLLTGAGACVPRVVVRPEVIAPAQIPVRSFPSIWVAGGGSPDDERLLDAVAQHLAADRATEVRRVAMAELEPAREAGAIPTATVVLALGLELQDSTRAYTGQQPVQYCGFSGCWVTYANYVGTTPVTVGKAKATVYDGPSAQVLQERTFSAEVAGEDIATMHRNVALLLAEQVGDAVDMVRTPLRIPLPRARVEGLDAPLKLMKRGQYAAARPLLEALSQRLGGLTRKAQAAVWFDLGVARWFAAGDAGLDAQSYAAAKRAFTWAQTCDPRSGAGRALRELDADWARQQIRVQQEQARAYNFSLVAPAAPAATPAPAAAPPAPSAEPPPSAPAPPVTPGP